MNKILLALIAMLLIVRIAFACDCRDLGIQEHYNIADIVFVGEAAKVNEIGKDNFSIEFKVQKLYKGSLEGDSIVINTASDCYYRFEANKIYIVFADMHKDTLDTDMCSGTQELVPGSETERTLERITYPNAKE